MRFARSTLTLCILLFAIPSWANQGQTSATPPSDQTGTAPSPAPKDPQAVSVIGQALAVGGGTSNFMSLADYTASGTVAYHQNQDIQGTITVTGLGLGESRQ